jgi:hypothetical protein
MNIDKIKLSEENQIKLDRIEKILDELFEEKKLLDKKIEILIQEKESIKLLMFDM